MLRTVKGCWPNKCRIIIETRRYALIAITVNATGIYRPRTPLLNAMEPARVFRIRGSASKCVHTALVIGDYNTGVTWLRRPYRVTLQ